MNDKYICLRQFERSGLKLPQFMLDEIGIGDCSTCKYNPEENKNCKGYFPIKVGVLEVKESELEEKIMIKH